MSDTLFTTLLEETDNDYASIMDEDTTTDINRFIDTGSYTFNALLSGSIYGGIIGNRGTCLSGEPSTGKTFFALNVCKQFLQDNPDGFIFYFETESAISRQMLVDRGLDIKRFAIIPILTVQEFRTQAIRILDKYLEVKEKDRKPMMFVLDSLGNLSTTKEIEDIREGKDTRDMTRAPLLRGAFRVLTLKLGQANVPLVLTNHVYDQIGCAKKGTKVKTIEGDKNIEDVKIGDKVLTMVGYKPVDNKFEYETNEYYSIEFEDGVCYSLTGEHKLMVQNGEWKKVSELTEEDIIISIF